jgi:prolyl-tRNA synthetase
VGPDGRSVVVTMGSYGIGISRAVAAIAEATLDDLGLCWPREVAPADAHVVSLGTAEDVRSHSEHLVGELASRGVHVLHDDRPDASPGVKLKDAELIGIPTIVVIGKRLADDIIEVRDRRSGKTDEVPAAESVEHLSALCAR